MTPSPHQTPSSFFVSFFKTHWGDWILLALLALIALLWRLPNLLTIPMVTDEFAEGSLAVRMASRQVFPLTADAAYIGPYGVYILALAFRLLGTSFLVARGTVLAIAVLTVLATYLLGKELAKGDWRGGLVAGILLAGNAYHILYNSHVAWTAEISPLFATLGFWAYLKGRRALQARWLVLTGFLLGVAVSCHPLIIGVVPGLVLDSLILHRNPSKFARRSVVLAVLAFVIVFLPQLYDYTFINHNLLHTIADRTYAIEANPTIATTLTNLGVELLTLGQMLSGTFAQGTTALILANPASAISLLLLAVTTVVLAWQKEYFYPLTWLSAAVIIAIINKFYYLPPASRYIAFFLPLVYAAFALLFIQAYDALRTQFRFGGVASAWLFRIAAIGIIAFASYYSLANLNSLYKSEIAAGRTNDSMLIVAEALKLYPPADVVLDSTLAKNFTGPGGDMVRSLQYLLLLQGVQAKPITLTTTPDNPLSEIMSKSPRGYVIMNVSWQDQLNTPLPLDKVVEMPFGCWRCDNTLHFGMYQWLHP